MLIVHAKHVPSNRTVTLFSVVHRPGAPYPAKIQPRDDELPDILKKSYYRPGIADLAMIKTSGQHVTNQWVCDTPAEFRSEVQKVFNLGVIKSEVLSLVSAAWKSPIAGGGAETSGNAAGDKPKDASS
jgi:hypothetical protein